MFQNFFGSDQPFKVYAGFLHACLKICALRLASKNNVSISPTSWGSICVRPEILAMIDAGVRSWSAYLRARKDERNGKLIQRDLSECVKMEKRQSSGLTSTNS